MAAASSDVTNEGVPYAPHRPRGGRGPPPCGGHTSARRPRRSPTGFAKPSRHARPAPTQRCERLGGAAKHTARESASRVAPRGAPAALRGHAPGGGLGDERRLKGSAATWVARGRQLGARHERGCAPRAHAPRGRLGRPEATLARREAHEHKCARRRLGRPEAAGLAAACRSSTSGASESELSGLVARGSSSA